MTLIEKAWYQGHKIAWLLLPLSGLFYLLSSIRRLLFKLGVKQSYHPQIPVIVVGNISVGGTGKTPFTIWLVEQLKQAGYKPAIVTRGYGNTLSAYPHVVKNNDAAQLVGDEPKLLAENCQVPVVIAPKRIDAAKTAKALGCNVVISDDGLQHYALQRDIEIILLDAKRGLGNGWLLPAGPLREGKWRLSSTKFVLYNCGANLPEDCLLEEQRSQALMISADEPRNMLEPELSYDKSASCNAVCAIGNPQRFYNSLAQCDIQIGDSKEFIDHHQFTEADFHFTHQRPVIMTEKDAVKCRHFAKQHFWFLPIEAKVNPIFKNNLINQLTELKTKYDI
ncbi:tetraacyldisaccharide 4'-kinase [Saccharobesus litoralis]|nr:tetraacyldisaccharide 4'-kinase [Saccharobesus litoralis]